MGARGIAICERIRHWPREEELRPPFEYHSIGSTKSQGKRFFKK